jgi:LmbE family N-acetylglucosaminyl deacetylase
MNDRILVFAPHTDDGELGAGGSISRFIDEGKDVYYAVFSLCEKSVPEGYPKDILKCEFEKACRTLGIKESNITIFNYPIREFPQYRQEILENMVQLQKDISPDLILVPSLHDTHQDHEVISREALRSFKKIASILGYEEPWNHVTFLTTAFIQLEKANITKKLEAIRQYESQQDNSYFDDELIKGLARVRGTQINTEYAEAFEVIRWVIK